MSQILSNRRQPTSVWGFMSDFERLFEDAWAPALTEERLLERYQPRVDVKETADSYLFSVDLPGLNRNQIKVDYHGGRLTISGERTKETVSDENKVHRVEREYGRFERVFQMPTEIQEDKIQARYEDGVLEVLAPKAQVAKTRSIAIDSEKKGLFSKFLGSPSPEKKDEH